MTTFQNLKRTATLTQFLTPDSKVPTIESAKLAGSDLLRTARMVQGSFTWLTPGINSPDEKDGFRYPNEKMKGQDQDDGPKYSLIAVSSSAMRDLGLKDGEEKTQLFRETMAGRINKNDNNQQSIYPWAQAYAGWQFGQWAGQLGDGRAVSLFEATNPINQKRYELQLKGAGLTPYSRFADGKAVLRSSIREALGSEAVNALGIPTTRALSLVSLPETIAIRETLESCAIICRMAETWIRIGTFDLHRSRGARKEMRKLADYCIEHVFGYEPNVNKDPIDSKSPLRYEILYNEIVTRNAKTTALWQAYAFLNGVLNTDNTSIFGLTLDYGPFAFMDTFDANYTPNHDDGELRYSYQKTPSVILWNLVRLGEDLGELLGAGPDLVDDPAFIEKGIQEDQIPTITKRAEEIILTAQKTFETVFLNTYHETMRKRLGFLTSEPDDHDKNLTPLLDMMQDCEVDYNQFFRKLGNIELFKNDNLDLNVENFFPQIRGFAPMYSLEDAKLKLSNWLTQIYIPRLKKEGSISDSERKERMHKTNPKFILKGWILDEVIHNAKKGDYSLYHKVLTMSLEPFGETWGFSKEEEDRLTGDVPRSERDSQCSCSS